MEIILQSPSPISLNLLTKKVDSKELNKVLEKLLRFFLAFTHFRDFKKIFSQLEKVGLSVTTKILRNRIFLTKFQ